MSCVYQTQVLESLTVYYENCLIYKIIYQS